MTTSQSGVELKKDLISAISSVQHTKLAIVVRLKSISFHEYLVTIICVIRFHGFYYLMHEKQQCMSIKTSTYYGLVTVNSKNRLHIQFQYH